MKGTIVRQLKKNGEAVRYLFFGALTTAAGVGLFELFFRLGFGAVRANTFSTIGAVLLAYVTNKLWVFESRDFAPGRVAAELLRFAAGRLFTFACETAALYVLVDRMAFHGTATKLVTTVIVIVLNYVISKKLVFLKKPVDRPRAG